MLHYERIQVIMSKYKNYRIIALGDFNLTKIKWIADELNSYYLPSTNTTDTNEPNQRVGYSEEADEFLNKMISLPMFQLSNERNPSGNVLDLVFSMHRASIRQR